MDRSLYRVRDNDYEKDDVEWLLEVVLGLFLIEIAMSKAKGQPKIERCAVCLKLVLNVKERLKQFLFSHYVSL